MQCILIIPQLILKRACHLIMWLSDIYLFNFYFFFISSLLVDDLELVSLLEAQVTIMVGFITVYGHHKVVYKRNAAFHSMGV